ncbi:type III secretion system gatekeeper subunit SctW [Pantoea endophytica]|uniref:Type III secretion system gatekeeper subunit SctW n=1 Tax=Pantoea sp. BJ2 TaxID=3141322 RepID=A0AAU7U3M3_9GAMM
MAGPIQHQVSVTPARLAEVRERQEARGQTELSRDLTGSQNTNIADDTDSNVPTLQQFLSSVDEISAYVALIRNRREIEKRTEFLNDPDIDYILDDEGHEHVNSLINAVRVAAVKAKDKSESKWVLFPRARELFRDDSCLIAALRVMLNRRRLFPEETDIIQEALNEAQEQCNSKATKAGLNIALKARIFGRKLKLSPSIVRNAYREFLEGDDSEVLSYEKWVVLFGASRRHIIIDFIESALLADIESHDPSCTMPEFGMVLRRLTQIKVLRTSDDLFINGLFEKIPEMSAQVAHEDLILFLLCLLSDSDSFADSLNQLTEKFFSGLSQWQKSFFVQMIYNHAKKLPVEMYLSNEHRDILLENIIELLTDISNNQMHEMRVLKDDIQNGGGK